MSDSNEEEQLLQYVPLDGRPIGNTAVINKLGWEEGQYWEVRNRLIDRGVLERGRGRGGSVYRPQVAAPITIPLPSRLSPAAGQFEAPDALEEGKEVELYAPMAKVIEERWTKDQRVESAIVQVTAQQGKRKTGGKWTRPDVTVATLATYPYIPGRHFDVVSFEIKNYDSIDVTAVYEALAHLRAATRAYVLFHVPKTVSEQYEEDLTEVCAEAKKHGIGVIVAAKPDDYETWEEFVETTRREPDPRRLNDFLARQFTQEQLEKLIKWFK